MCSPWGLVELRLVCHAFFTFFRGVYFLLTGSKKASDLKGDRSFLSFVSVCCHIFSLLFSAFKIEDGSPSRTIKSWLFQGLYHLSTFIAQWNLLISLENHLFIKAYMHIRYLIANNYVDLHIPNLAASISLSRKERFPFITTFELYLLLFYFK